MPTAAEYQKLADELRQLGAVFTQAINLGDQELALWAAGALSSAVAQPAWWAREAADNEAAAVAAAAIESPAGVGLPPLHNSLFDPHLEHRDVRQQRDFLDEIKLVAADNQFLAAVFPLPSATGRNQHNPRLRPALSGREG